MKQILVLFAELANCQLGQNSTVPKQVLENRLSNLLLQIKALSKLVLKFEPLSYMNSADVANTRMGN